MRIERDASPSLSPDPVAHASRDATGRHAQYGGRVRGVADLEPTADPGRNTARLPVGHRFFRIRPKSFLGIQSSTRAELYLQKGGRSFLETTVARGGLVEIDVPKGERRGWALVVSGAESSSVGELRPGLNRLEDFPPGSWTLAFRSGGETVAERTLFVEPRARMRMDVR